MISIIVLSLVMTSFASDQIEGYGAYDENYAYKLWLLCSASYCGQDRIRNWNCHKPCDDTAPLQDITVLLNSSSEVAGYTAYDPKNNNIYIVLRGTVPWQIKNWVEDIDFIKTSYPYCNNGCQVHRGFYHSFQSIEKQLLNSVKAIKALHSSATLTITGHSLGGALATHALVYLTKQGYKINKFYTFGSPRVGDKAFFEWLSRTLFTGEKFRITHSHDPVPHLPLYDQGFHHINTEAYYKEILWVFKQFTICNDSLQEDPHCANSNLLDLNINDHMDYMGYNIAVETLTCQ